MSKKNVVIILFLLILLIVIILSIYFKRYEEKIEVSQNSNNHIVLKSSSANTVSENANNFENNTKSTNSYTPENIVKNNNNKSHEPVNQQEIEKRSVENVKVEVLEDTVSKNGATVIITDNNEISFSWNKEVYRIEQKQDGNWSEVNPNRDGFDVLLIGYGRDENNQLKFELNWEEYYGTLQNGIYRVVEMPTDAKGVIAYSNEFEIK